MQKWSVVTGLKKGLMAGTAIGMGLVAGSQVLGAVTAGQQVTAVVAISALVTAIRTAMNWWKVNKTLSDETFKR